MNPEINALMTQANTFSDPPDQGVVLPLEPFDRPADSARFSELMAGSGIEPVSGVPQLDGSTSITRTMGDMILAKLDNVGSKFTTAVEKMHHRLDNWTQTQSLPELLKLQIDVAIVGLEVELVGKSVSKAVQHVDQLSKLQ